MVGLKTARPTYAANAVRAHKHKKNRGTRMVPRFSHLARKEGFEPSGKMDIRGVIAHPSFSSCVIL